MLRVETQMKIFFNEIEKNGETIPDTYITKKNVGNVKKILEHQNVVGNFKKTGDTHLVCKPKRPLKTIVISHAESQD